MYTFINDYFTFKGVYLLCMLFTFSFIFVVFSNLFSQHKSLASLPFYLKLLTVQT